MISKTTLIKRLAKRTGKKLVPLKSTKIKVDDLLPKSDKEYDFKNLRNH